MDADRGTTNAADSARTAALCDGLFVSSAPGFEQWLSDRRDRLRGQAAQAGWTVCEEAERTGDLRAACDIGSRALREDPDEERLRWLLSMHARAGDRIGAIRLMQRFERDLAEQYELEPSPETMAVIDRITQGRAGWRMHTHGPGSKRTPSRQTTATNRSAPRATDSGPATA